MSATDILQNSPYLHSLKRSQLIKLCKRHGLKATGKNVELVTKLQLHAKTMPPDAPLVYTSDMGYASTDDGTEDGEEGEGSLGNKPKVRPSEIWEVIEEETKEELKALESQGNTLNGQGSIKGNAGEFGNALGVTKSELSCLSVRLC